LHRILRGGGTPGQILDRAVVAVAVKEKEVAKWGVLARDDLGGGVVCVMCGEGVESGK
jgi:hypothetical protein